MAGTHRGPRPGHNLGFSVGIGAMDQNRMNHTPGKNFAENNSIIADTQHGETFYTLNEGVEEDTTQRTAFTNRTKVNKDKIKVRFDQFMKDAKDPAFPDKRNYVDFARMLIDKHPKIKIADLKTKIR